MQELVKIAKVELLNKEGFWWLEDVVWYLSWLIQAKGHSILRRFIWNEKGKCKAYQWDQTYAEPNVRSSLETTS